MGVKDRERLALSTGIALVGYGGIFLLLAGLQWPSEIPSRSIRVPMSVTVNLGGTNRNSVFNSPPTVALHETVPVPPVPKAPAPVTTKTRPTTKVPTTVNKTAAPVSPPPPNREAAASVSGEPAPHRVPLPTAGSAETSPTTTVGQNASVAQSVNPRIPSSMTSSAGPTPSTGSQQSQAETSRALSESGTPLSGAASPKPGVTYPPGNNSNAAPPPGTGGTGTPDTQGRSQTIYGPPASTTGSIFSPQLAETAGRANGTGSTNLSNVRTTPSIGVPPGESRTSGTPGNAVAGGTIGGAVGGTAARAAAGVLKIEWKGDSSSREVLFRPKPLVIPKRYLNEIPPAIILEIEFQVTPLGIVHPLNITPSLGYPELDNELEAWMGKWRFQPITGKQIAQGTLRYMIQAETAR